VGACSHRLFDFYFSLHGAVHALVFGILSPFSGWLVLGRMFPCTRLSCLLRFVQGSQFPLLVHVMFCWFPACTASLSCSFLIYTILTFDQKKKNRMLSPNRKVWPLVLQINFSCSFREEKLLNLNKELECFYYLGNLSNGLSHTILVPCTQFKL
jgi:hypothetical protein